MKVIEVEELTEYRIGTGGWAYFKIPNKYSLKAYSAHFNFVEVNYSFYEYPDFRMVVIERRHRGDEICKHTLSIP